MDYELEGKIILRLDSTCDEFLTSHELDSMSIEVEPDILQVKDALESEIKSWLNALHIEVEVQLEERK